MDTMELNTSQSNVAAYPIWRWIALFVLYLIGTFVSGQLDRSLYAWSYATLAGLLLVLAWNPIRFWELVRPHFRVGLPILVGLFGIILWIGISKTGLDAQLAKFLPSWAAPAARQSFDPFQEIASDWERVVFIVARIAGLSVVVPLAEELFWRGFLMRWLIREDFEQVAIGTYAPFSFWMVVLLFTLAHPEWFSAAVYCILLNGYLCWKKDLWGCVIAHAVSNFALAIYVLFSRDWYLW